LLAASVRARPAGPPRAQHEQERSAERGGPLGGARVGSPGGVAVAWGAVGIPARGPLSRRLRSRGGRVRHRRGQFHGGPLTEQVHLCSQQKAVLAAAAAPPEQFESGSTSFSDATCRTGCEFEM